jgi:hypothetical protein
MFYLGGARSLCPIRTLINAHSLRDIGMKIFKGARCVEGFRLMPRPPKKIQPETRENVH